MWLFTTDGFLSIVSKDCRPDQVMVRARVKADLKRAFPKAVIRTTRPPADYRYRAVVTRKALAAYLARVVGRLAYANFKDTVRDDARHQAYMRVWQAMFALQEARPEKRLIKSARTGQGWVIDRDDSLDEQPPPLGLFDDVYEDAGVWHPNKRRA
jgi:hypothetical protein